MCSCRRIGSLRLLPEQQAGLGLAKLLVHHHLLDEELPHFVALVHQLAVQLPAFQKLVQDKIGTLLVGLYQTLVPPVSFLTFNLFQQSTCGCLSRHKFGRNPKPNKVGLYFRFRPIK
jgi:hypothetical protein